MHSRLSAALSFSIAFVAACNSSNTGGAGTAGAGGSGAAAAGGSNTGGSGGHADSGTCPANANITTIVSDVSDFIGASTLDANYIYVAGQFDGEGNGGVNRYPKVGGAGEPLAATVLNLLGPDRPQIIGTDLYFVASMTGDVYKVPVAGGAAIYAKLVAAGYNMFSMRQTLTDGNALYVLAFSGIPSQAVIDRITPDGASQRIAELGDGQWRMALSGSDVFASGGPVMGTKLVRVPKTGGTLETVRPDTQCLNGLAITADSIFCARQSLDRMPRSGGNATTLYSSPATLDGLTEVAFNADASVAYVADAMGDGNADQSQIVRVDTATGTSTTLACGLGPPHWLALSPTELAWTVQYVAVTKPLSVQILEL